MMRDRKVRREVTKNSFSHFFNFYFAEYVTYPTAGFQKEIIYKLESSVTDNIYVVAFRGSGKSTYITTAYPLWAILGKQGKMHVLIFSKTQGQVKQILRNIREEAENNNLLKQDLGPFHEESDTGKNGEWTSTTLVFANTGARIRVASVDESMRGLRHKQYRPDLVLCDDVEDINSNKTREGRNKTYKWLRGDVMPSGDRNTRFIVTGNLLHEDSLLMRLKEDLEEDRATGEFFEFPLITTKGVCLWPGKYPTVESLDLQKKEVGSEIEWQREFLLNIVPDTDQVIHKSWFKYYSDLPKKDESFCGVCIGIDIAFSMKDTADKTAMVSAYVYKREKEMYIYILPNPVNEHLDSPATVEKCKIIHRQYQIENMWPRFIVEEAGQQLGIIQHLRDAGLLVQGFKVGRLDKRTRNALTAPKIKSGHILFPKYGCETLIQQLVHFGVERYDDLSDAFSTLILGILENPPARPSSADDIILGGKPPDFPETGQDDNPITPDMKF